MSGDLPPGYSLAQSGGPWYVDCPSPSIYAEIAHDDRQDAETTAWLIYALATDPTPWRAFRALCWRHAEIRRDNHGERSTGLGLAAACRALGRDPRLIRRWCSGALPIPPEVAWRLREIVRA